MTPEATAAMCDGKERYASPALAHRVLKRRRRAGINVVVYRCQVCSGYHQGGPIFSATAKVRQ